MQIIVLFKKCKRAQGILIYWIARTKQFRQARILQKKGVIRTLNLHNNPTQNSTQNYLRIINIPSELFA